MGEEGKPQSLENYDAPTRPGSTNLDYQSPDTRKLATQPGSLTNFNFDLEVLESGKKQAPETPKDEAIQVKESVLNGWISLNQGITKRNFYFAWVFVMYLGFILIGLSTLEPEYISKTFNVPLDHMGKTTAMLYLIDYSIRLCFALLWGPMIDHFGRKFVMTIGIILVSLGFLLIPFVSFSLVPGYIIGKSLLSSGVIALSMLPFSADYVDNSTKGVMTGVNFGIGFAGGAISGILVKSCLWFSLPYKTIYWIHAPILLIVGFLLRTGIKGGNTYYKVNKVEDVLQVQEKGTKLKEIKKAYKEIPWLPIANLFGILGNTDFYIMTTGLMIWVKSLIPANQDPTMIATTYQVIFFGLSVLSTTVAALKIDKVSHMKIIFPVLICATIGFSIIPFTHSPHSFLVYLFLIIEGFSLPGVFVFSTYLSIRYAPSGIRGTLSGIGNCFCFLGAIIILSLGGFLNDHWRSDSSFILYGGLLLSTFVIVTILYFTKIKAKYNTKPNDTEMVRLRVL